MTTDTQRTDTQRTDTQRTDTQATDTQRTDTQRTDTEIVSGESGKVRVDEFRLAKFIVLLVLDDKALNNHLDDPTKRRARMNEAKLSDEEQRLLGTACFLELCSYLARAGTGPAPNTEGSGSDTGGGGGGGTGGGSGGGSGGGY